MIFVPSLPDAMEALEDFSNNQNVSEKEIDKEEMNNYASSIFIFYQEIGDLLGPLILTSLKI